MRTTRPPIGENNMIDKIINDVYEEMVDLGDFKDKKQGLAVSNASLQTNINRLVKKKHVVEAQGLSERANNVLSYQANCKMFLEQQGHLDETYTRMKAFLQALVEQLQEYKAAKIELFKHATGHETAMRICLSESSALLDRVNQVRLPGGTKATRASKNRD